MGLNGSHTRLNTVFASAPDRDAEFCNPGCRLARNAIAIRCHRANGRASRNSYHYRFACEICRDKTMAGLLLQAGNDASKFYSQLAR
jgi:hypothetical protein